MSYFQVSYFYLPYLLIALFYDNWILFQNITTNNFNIIDKHLMHIDAFLFGIQPTIMLQRFIHPVAVDYFMITYSMFIIYPFFYLIYLIQKNELLLFQKVLLAQNIAIVFSLCCFIIFPAMGPRVLLAPEYATPLQGISSDILKELTGRESIFLILYDLWNYIERVKTDCIPSMHACLCLLCLIYALKYRNLFKKKKLAVNFWVIGVGSLIVSTIYLRYHWIIDVLIGAILAIIVYFIAEQIFKYWIAYRIKKGFPEMDVPWIIEVEKIRNNLNY